MNSLTSIRSFYRLADGVNTLFLANDEGRLLDIIDVERWSRDAGEARQLQVACAKRYQSHARATQHHGHVCAVLSDKKVSSNDCECGESQLCARTPCARG